MFKIIPVGYVVNCHYVVQVLWLSRLHHKNLVRLEGFCDENNLQVRSPTYPTSTPVIKGDIFELIAVYINMTLNLHPPSSEQLAQPHKLTKFAKPLFHLITKEVFAPLMNRYWYTNTWKMETFTISSSVSYTRHFSLPDISLVEVEICGSNCYPTIPLYIMNACNIVTMFCLHWLLGFSDLAGKRAGKYLDWYKRLEIAVHIAQGLEYLHSFAVSVTLSLLHRLFYAPILHLDCLISSITITWDL